MMTLDELMTPSRAPEAIQKLAKSLDEYALATIEAYDIDVQTIALLGAAAGALEAFARHLAAEAAQPEAAGPSDPLTLSDM